MEREGMNRPIFRCSGFESNLVDMLLRDRIDILILAPSDRPRIPGYNCPRTDSAPSRIDSAGLKDWATIKTPTLVDTARFYLEAAK
jgi:hypothetical protein